MGLQSIAVKSVTDDGQAKTNVHILYFLEVRGIKPND